MRDEYLLKLKLRDGAINLAQALSHQSSRDAKEKLQAVRAEQRDLLEVHCMHLEITMRFIHVHTCTCILYNECLESCFMTRSEPSLVYMLTTCSVQCTCGCVCWGGFFLLFLFFLG